MGRLVCMTATAAAVFIQALPVMFIVVFIGEQRVTREKPRWIVARLAIVALLVLAPLTVALLAIFVINGDPAPFPLNWLTWVSTLGLAVAMMDIAVKGTDRDKRPRDDKA